MSSFIEKLSLEHKVESFDSGEEALNKFFKNYAYSSQQSNASKTYVGISRNEIVGFYTIVAGAVVYDDAPERIQKGLARHPIPIAVLARLAVSKEHQGRGIGAGLLKDAMIRIVSISETIGIRAFVAHAKDEKARSFYEHFGFIASPTNPLHLFILVKDIHKYLK
ncbi:GCN5-related N-acetyltransferase (plasmid) [Calothrix sp. NIES-4101]|nr:GCN5-related N-acetyltransferase [Calothrix sp. NIES-4101]